MRRSLHPDQEVELAHDGGVVCAASPGKVSVWGGGEACVCVGGGGLGPFKCWQLAHPLHSHTLPPPPAFANAPSKLGGILGRPVCQELNGTKGPGGPRALFP